ncbi:hypothetical protein Tco_1533787 [Tanacetum coccineum]
MPSGTLRNFNKSFPTFRVKSVGSTAPLEKCCEMRKLDNTVNQLCQQLLVQQAAATGTVDTTIVGGLKYSSNKGWNKVSHSSLFGRLQDSEKLSLLAYPTKIPISAFAFSLPKSSLSLVG